MADIVITEFMDDEVARALAATHDVLYEKDLVDRPADLRAALGDCRALIVRNRTRVGPELLDHAPNLRVVGRLGVGLDRIDLEACKARGSDGEEDDSARAASIASPRLAIESRSFLRRSRAAATNAGKAMVPSIEPTAARCSLFSSASSRSRSWCILSASSSRPASF